MEGGYHPSFLFLFGGLMKNHGRFLLITISYFMAAVSVAQTEIKGEFVAGEYIIKVKNQVGALSTSQVGPMMANLNANVKDVISSDAKTMVIRKSIIERPEAVIDQLKGHPMIEFAEPNYIYRASKLPDDSRLSDLWGLVNKSKASGGVDINAQEAWDITTGSKNIVVAVIDTGVNYNDADLKNNMWVNQAEASGQPGVDDDGNGFIDDIYGYDFANEDGDPMDDNNHGTHVSGTIGAEGNNGLGVVGVNWNVSIMALKFLTGSGSGTLESALKAIDYATAQGVDIMSNSWGGGGESQFLKEAIQRAEQAGILFVAAAGNNRSNNDVQPSYPANYDIANVISVAAVDSRGNLASFSNYGKTTVHVAAPGVDILSTGKSGLLTLSGTSMATPHVSGVAALVLANEPNLSLPELKTRLLNTSQPTSKLRKKVLYGMVNAYAAVSNTVPPADPNDPSVWPSLAESVSTDHPYVDKTDQSFTVTVPGAQKIAVHFDKFETEKGFDKVFFFDSAGVKVGEMSGSQDDSYSPVVVGETMVIQFVSDYSIVKYGFNIDRVHYKGAIRSQWRSETDVVSTDHPYPRYVDKEVVFEQAGASEIKIKFGQFETEKNYDFVYFYDGDGNLLERWDGNHSGEFSPIAQGDRIVVRLKTDYSIQEYGFDVEEVYFR